MSRTYFAPDGQTSASDQYQQFAENATQPISNQSPTHDSTGPTGAPEGYSLVYADNAFQDTDTTSQYHAAAGAGESPDGTTFEDRLRSLMRRQGDELRAFAEREARNVDEVNTITRMDAALEHLHQALGYDGFLAVVTPVDADGDGGITAGTKVGLEFWKGLRGGGLAGLKSLKLRCKASRETMGALSDRLGGNTNSTTTSTASRKSLDIKQELNSAMRNALREAAGDPLAEMRWTKPDQLEGYGVRIIGWPPEIALRNPSNNPVRDNKTLLQLLKSGQLRFVRKDSAEWEQADPSALVRSTAQALKLKHRPKSSHSISNPPNSYLPNPGGPHHFDRIHTSTCSHPHAQPPASLQHPPPLNKLPKQPHPHLANLKRCRTNNNYNTPKLPQVRAGQGPSPIPPPPSGAVSPNATTARKRRSEAGGAGGGKKRNRTTVVEAASG
ncbi:hypothetical protein RHS01_08453 [Rhizoctonia solani]|uniref:Uncharacterized protein n=1 Tax=Rhizoctonia solani TaxID=456999 RepID=A0A8H7M266_9AGAM|nr:hypothetical protein RHS01_08453 [Rhizoctonia solani]